MQYVVSGIPVEIERKKVRRFNLRVRPDKTVHLSIPERASLAQAQVFLDGRAKWLKKAMARIERAENSCVEGADGVPDIPLWGELVAFPVGRVLEDFYRQALEARLPDVVHRMEEATGLHAASWQLRAMKSRWGSCTPKTGKIRINVFLAAYPPICLDYVVAHELTHLKEPSHNARFHQLVRQVIPNEAQVRALFKQTPHELVLAQATLSGTKSSANGNLAQ